MGERGRLVNMSAVIVTRGDVDLEPCLAPIKPFIDDIVIWDNSVEQDMGVFGRFAALDRCKHDFVYTQDDDCVVPVSQLMASYAGDFACPLLVNNVPPEHPFLGWGAIFPKTLPALYFHTYLERWPADDLFRRWCDVIFGEMAFAQRVDFGHTDLPWAEAPNRMFMQPDHYTSQEIVRQRCQELLKLQPSAS